MQQFWRSLMLATLLYATLANARTVVLNVNATRECGRNSFYKGCEFTDPKYWIGNIAPENGDAVIIPGGSSFLNLTQPMTLKSLVFEGNASTSALYPWVKIAFSRTLIIEDVNHAGYVKLEPMAGRIGYYAIEYINYHYLHYATNVMATMKNFTASTLAASGSSIQADTLNLGGLELYGATITCNSLVTERYYEHSHYRASINCASVTFSGAGDYVEMHNTEIRAEQVKFSGHLRFIQINGTIGATTVTFDVLSSNVELASAATLISPNAISFSNRITSLHLDGTIFAPTVTVDAPFVAMGGTINAAQTNLKRQSNFYPPKWSSGPALTVNGSLAVGPDLKWTVQRDASSGELKLGMIVVAGELTSYDSFASYILVSWQIDQFMVPDHPLILARYQSTTLHSASPYTYEDSTMAFKLTPTELIATYNVTIAPNTPTQQETGSSNGPAVIILSVLCACLGVAVIGLTFAVFKKRKEAAYVRLQ